MNKLEWFNKIITFKIAAALVKTDSSEDDNLLLGSKVPGAYVIVHPETRQFYVGSTDDLAVRKYKHLWHISNGTHRNAKIKEAFQNVSAKNVFFFIWPTQSRKEAYDIEQKFLDATVENEKSLNIASDARLSGKGVKRSLELRKRISDSVKKIWTNPNHRELKSKLAKEYMANPDNRKRMIERVTFACNTEEFKSRQAEIANQQWSDPEARKRKSEEVKKYFQNPANKEKYKASRQHLSDAVSIDGQIFSSMSEAGRYYGIHRSMVRARVQSKKWKDWKYVKK